MQRGAEEHEVTEVLNLYSRGFIAGGKQLPYISLNKSQLVFMQV
jgi:hypothetical protein